MRPGLAAEPRMQLAMLPSADVGAYATGTTSRHEGKMRSASTSPAICLLRRQIW